MEKKQWFKLEDIKLDIDKNEFNDFEKLRKELKKENDTLKKELRKR